jgi:phosphoglycerate dehydrogenase-like enzyme
MVSARRSATSADRAVIVGTGDVGSHIAQLFSSLGAEVHGVSRTGRGDSAVFASLSTVSQLPSLAATADWLIVTVPTHRGDARN